MPSLPSMPRPGAGRREVREADVPRVPVPVARAVVDCGVYVDGVRLPGRFSYVEAIEEVRRRGEGYVWVGLLDPDQHQMDEVARVFGLHPLTVEDTLVTHTRPKVDRFDDTLFLILKTVNYVGHDRTDPMARIVETGEVMVLVGPDHVITVRHGDHGSLRRVRRNLEANPELLKLGPSAVMHAVADHVVDSYVAVSDLLEDDIDRVEEDVFRAGARTQVDEIYQLKRDIVELRRGIHPLSHALKRLTCDFGDIIPQEIQRYFSDVLDHQAMVADHVETYNDVLSSLIDAAVAKIGMQQNEDMRKMSAIIGLVAVPTMIAGIYGMNFDNMPELHWQYGYFIVLAIMLVACLGLFVVFRRIKWL
ncbi:magnesium/cobalt transporter CorA [Tsukamurella paurometabola]|uniref:Magnesium transport protein CorA n=1 Tax=Tsukamurella paurometabola TaxID=2061 RepID=A0A3P8JV02_TSUPA|nr:magnesium/cobalt transporter CorA [Tsukamurella paurometabola]MBS4101522.1 magnesium/cobalt transporter CorA [Tsukamurella paurometabola]UEA84599.1 magnesium/cobalt transporter CorA [Tsukamurella paurometabola]VDR37169.1 Magnesium transport protein CorA [Tsukamurella paurometabola]